MPLLQLLTKSMVGRLKNLKAHLRSDISKPCIEADIKVLLPNHLSEMCKGYVYAMPFNSDASQAAFEQPRM
jgi:hypothetical protein